MAGLDYTDIKAGVYFTMDGVVFETIDATFSKKSRQKGSNQVRIKNLLTGAVLTKTLHASDQLQTVDIEKENYVYVYVQGDSVVVHPENAPSNRLTLPAGSFPNAALLPSKTKVTALLADGAVVQVQPPIKVDVLVREAPPNVRGNTAQGGTKRIVIETGATVTAPLFIETGDRIRINTETGAYVERVTKA